MTACDSSSQSASASRPFVPYSPGQAVAIEADGDRRDLPRRLGDLRQGRGPSEDPGPDLASYPLSQVPDEAATLVRALLSADRNQQYLRSRMTEAQRAATQPHDFRPFIIADADTGHGGEPHVRNLIRRFVEAGVAATISKTSARAPRSAAIRAAKCLWHRTSRTSD